MNYLKSVLTVKGGGGYMIVALLLSNFFGFEITAEDIGFAVEGAKNLADQGVGTILGAVAMFLIGEGKKELDSK
jgi:hypothetical protein